MKAISKYDNKVQEENQSYKDFVNHQFNKGTVKKLQIL